MCWALVFHLSVGRALSESLWALLVICSVFPTCLSLRYDKLLLTESNWTYRVSLRVKMKWSVCVQSSSVRIFMLFKLSLLPPTLSTALSDDATLTHTSCLWPIGYQFHNQPEQWSFCGTLSQSMLRTRLTHWQQHSRLLLIIKFCINFNSFECSLTFLCHAQ